MPQKGREGPCWPPVSVPPHYQRTHPHGCLKGACQDVVDWKLRVITPDLTRNHT